MHTNHTIINFFYIHFKQYFKKTYKTSSTHRSRQNSIFKHVTGSVWPIFNHLYFSPPSLDYFESNFKSKYSCVHEKKRFLKKQQNLINISKTKKFQKNSKISLIYLKQKNFFFQRYWGLNLGPHTCYVVHLPLEPLHQHFAMTDFFEIGSCELFAHLSGLVLKPWSSRSLPPE
jgi:hypothetical protein